MSLLTILIEAEQKEFDYSPYKALKEFGGIIKSLFILTYDRFLRLCQNSPITSSQAADITIYTARLLADTFQTIGLEQHLLRALWQLIENCFGIPSY